MEARRRGNEADAVTYLMSSEGQAELKRIIVEASMNSMAAERKHWQDRRSEKTKVVSLTTASRNSQLSQYKRVREARTKQLAEARRRYESERHVNTWSLAVEKNKQWLPRPRGKLHWEHEVSDASARATVHAGDLESLRNFHDSNLESLKAERDARQEAAKLGLEVVLSDLPQTNSEWVGWIKRNESLFRDMLRNASGDRAKFSTCVFAENAQLPQDPRILPRRQAPVPAQSWMQKLLTSKPGFFCIQISGAKLWVFACHLLREVWALSLMKVGQGLLSLDNSVLLCDSFRPLPDVVAAAGLAVSVDAKDVIVHKVDVEVREASEDELILYVAYADLVEKPGRQQNVTEEDDEDDGELSFGKLALTSVSSLPMRSLVEILNVAIPQPQMRAVKTFGARLDLSLYAGTRTSRSVITNCHTRGYQLPRACRFGCSTGGQKTSYWAQKTFPKPSLG